MGIEGAINETKYNYDENKIVRSMSKEEKSFNKRVEDLSKNPENALKSEGIKETTKDLILEMKKENPLWGSRGISDELKKLTRTRKHFLHIFYL